MYDSELKGYGGKYSDWLCCPVGKEVKRPWTAVHQSPREGWVEEA